EGGGPADAEAVAGGGATEALTAPEPIAPAAQPLEEARVFAGLEGAQEGLLLLDASGRVLGGALKDSGGRDVTDAVAAYLAGVSQEAARDKRPRRRSRRGRLSRGRFPGSGAHRQAAGPGQMDRTRRGRKPRPRASCRAHERRPAARGARPRGTDGTAGRHRAARRPRGAPLVGGPRMTAPAAAYGKALDL